MNGAHAAPAGMGGAPGRRRKTGADGMGRPPRSVQMA